MAQGRHDRSYLDLQGQKTDDDVVREIEGLDDLRRYSAHQIREIVAAMPEYNGRVPKVRAVQGIIKRYRDRQGTEPWSFVHSTPEDARLVLPVLLHLSDASEGRRRLTRSEADWVARVAKVVPWLTDVDLWGFAAHYMKRIQQGKDTSRLDHDLGLFLTGQTFTAYRFPPYKNNIVPK